MRPIKLTDPVSGLEMPAIRSDAGDITVDTAFDGPVTLQVDHERGCVMVPVEMLRHRETMTLGECADYLGVSRMMVSRMCRDGRLASTKTNGAMVIDAESAGAMWEAYHGWDDRAV